MLEHNTTQFNTGISLRDAVIDYLFITYPACGENPSYYQLCSESLGETFSSDCQHIQDDGEKAACVAKAQLRAAELCEELPCVDIEADGRLERIFPTK